VNWNHGDYQCRIFRNGIGLKWHGNLHEAIKTTADTNQVFLAKHTKMALIHRKTIEQQRANNARYASVYTESENKSIIES
jgi:hypothetical protein